MFHAFLHSTVYLLLLLASASAWQINELPVKDQWQRRNVFLPIIVAACGVPEISQAANPTTAAEAIRRSAANLPNYGQTDIFFPNDIAGSWKVTRQVEFLTSGRSVVLSYPFRFIRSIEDDGVVADRGINQFELEQALVRTITGKDDEQPVRSYNWAVTNPNVLRLVLSDGSTKEIKVTKRATEKTADTVSSSEFQRVTQEGSRGIPTISARRVMTKWKVVDDNTIEALEVVYDAGGGDPLAGGQISSQPSILTKSRLSLTR